MREPLSLVSHPFHLVSVRADPCLRAAPPLPGSCVRARERPTSSTSSCSQKCCKERLDGFHFSHLHRRSDTPALCQALPQRSRSCCPDFRRLDELYTAYPFYGSRQMSRHLVREGYAPGRHRVRRLMRAMGLEAIYCKPRCSHPQPGHRVYPYLPRNLSIGRPHHVCCADITYIRLRGGYLYRVAVMDWASRCVLAWELSNTLDSECCVLAVEEALEAHAAREMFNTDQGSPFTAQAFTGCLEGAGVRISMDGRGRWMDNVFIERLRHSLKYEAVYLQELADGLAARARGLIGEWIASYNALRPHSSLAGRTTRETLQKGVRT